MKLVLAILILVGEARAEVSSVEELKPIQRAHEEVTEIRAQYKKALQKALKQKGTAGAIAECKLPDAIPDKTKVGRTSLKLRNPGNTAPAWVKPILDEWSAAKPSSIPKHKLVELGNHRYGYAEPIFTEPVCLDCHGKHISPMVRKTLKATYPEDKAIDFEVGQLRGLIWLESEP